MRPIEFTTKWTIDQAPVSRTIKSGAPINDIVFVKDVDGKLLHQGSWVCFANTYGYAKAGRTFGFRPSMTQLARRILEERRWKRVGFTGVEQFVDYWFAETARIWNEPLVKEAGPDSEEYVVLKCNSDKRSPLLARLTFLDAIQREPGIVVAYKKLRELMPEEDPWIVFQVANFLPTWNSPLDCEDDEVGMVSDYPADGGGHWFTNTIGGQFPLKATIQEAWKDVEERGLVMSFFDIPKFSAWEDTKKTIPHPKTKWVDWAEHLKQYIQKEKEAF